MTTFHRVDIRDADEMAFTGAIPELGGIVRISRTT
jgi:hypothetical protein